jgi:hypothetical protein
MAALGEINMNQHHKHNSEQDFNACIIGDDPLEHPEAIVVVKQSLDATINIDDEDEINPNNISNWSLSNPARNLMHAFEDTEEKLLLAKESWSPNGVDFTFSVENGSPVKSVMSNGSFQTFKIELPRFHLYENLKRDLPQPVVDRCSLYSVIHGVNKEVQDMAEQDFNCVKEPNPDDDSALVQAIKGDSKENAVKKNSSPPLAVLDEELFLLAAISSRGDDEKLSINPNNCPATFAEAIGELDTSSYDSSAQSENPLSVLANSKTQLWKPSRSWWEAKSGKNPWIEPRLHNKRWRFLWPLIHYHKFLAKCVKKLKRNNVDVKTSISPVSVFLREEVCAVSDHLGLISNFTSEEWMEALPHFHGWTDTSTEGEETLRKLVKSLPMRPLQEQSDVDSKLLRSQIDRSFLIAMADARKQMKSGGDDYVKNESFPDTSISSKFSKLGINTSRVSKRPPRPSNGKNRHNPGKAIPTGRRNSKNRVYEHGYNQESVDYSIIHPPAPLVPSMYIHPNMYDPYQPMPPMAYHYPSSHEYYNNGWVQVPPDYGYCDPNQTVQSIPVQGCSFYPQNGWGSFVPPQNLDSSVCSHPFEDASFSLDVTSAPDGVSLSFLGPSGEIRQTPVKKDSRLPPNSPHWEHLAHLTMKGVSSPTIPCDQYSQSPTQDNLNHPLLMQNLHQGNMVPSSPGYQCLMSQGHENYIDKNVVEKKHEESTTDESVATGTRIESESA